MPTLVLSLFISIPVIAVFAFRHDAWSAWFVAGAITFAVACVAGFSIGFFVLLPAMLLFAAAVSTRHFFSPLGWVSALGMAMAAWAVFMVVPHLVPDSPIAGMALGIPLSAVAFALWLLIMPRQHTPDLT